MRTATWITTSIFVCLAGGAALAAEPKADGPAQTEVWVIRATTKNKDVAPELKELAESLQKQFRYTGFTIAGRRPLQLKPEKAAKVDLLENYRLSLELRQRSAERLEMRIVLLQVVTEGGKQREKELLKTTLNMKPGPFSTLGCGELPDGDYLIAAIRAR